MPPGRRLPRDAFFLVMILAAAFGLRAAILATGQKFLRSDEAVVGIMARHIVDRGEAPLFLYGQSYGGGHAIEAFVAAPLFAIFGSSGALLTGISAALSLVSALLVWAIVRQYMAPSAALAAVALYAFSPPIIYQAFLINGGTVTFLLALISLWFFLGAYFTTEKRVGRELLAGLFAGLAYWGMDYALLYAIVFALLWAGARKWTAIARLVLGFFLGCFPLIYFNVVNDFAHVRAMFSGAPGPEVGIFLHFFGALAGLITGDLASFFGGDIDDMRKAGIGAWGHAALAIAAITILAISCRSALRDLFRNIQNRSTPARSQALAMCIIFVTVYLCMYGAAKFSLPGFRTPRYLLPLCPFLAIAIAHVLTFEKPKWLAQLAVAVVALVALQGALTAFQIGSRTWHYEHKIATSGPEMKILADELNEKGVKVAFSPYEIQWRLMFESRESIIVSSAGVSPVARYPWYEKTVEQSVFRDNVPFAFIFRKDFAFAEMSANAGLGVITREHWNEACRRAGISQQGKSAGTEFIYYYPLDQNFMRVLGHVINESYQKK